MKEESRSAVELIWTSLVDAYHLSGEIVTINLLWVLMTVPIFTAPAAITAVFYATNLLARGEDFALRVFFAGLRRYFWEAWLWFVLFLGVGALLVSNLAFYDRFQGAWVLWVRSAFVAMIFLWLLLQIYFLPLLVSQENLGFLAALRASAWLVAERPGLAVFLLVFLFLLATISVLLQLPWLIFTVGLGAFVTNRCALELQGFKPKPDLPLED